jgi:hypothetical protein
LAFVASGYGLEGCAGISSKKISSTAGADGLIYYLPQRNVLATVTVTDDGTTLLVSATESIPDLETPFVATVPRNLIGTSDSSIGINAVGLLHSDSSAKTTSQLSDIVEGIAGAAGASSGFRSFNQPDAGCTQKGTYSMVLKISSNGTFNSPNEFCGFTFELTPLVELNRLPEGAPTAPSESKSAPGLYYRQLIPYKVSAKRGNDPREFIVLSPTGSKTYFLPLARAVFANNTGEFTFENGVPTKYGQKIESELVGLVALPAQFIAAYFKAIGSAFTGRSESVTAQTQYLAAQNSLDAARAQREACLAALSTNDLGAIKVACSQ